MERPDGSKTPTFAIVTTAANRLMMPIHDRMPVILPRESEQLWLSPTPTMPELLEILRPVAAGRLRAYAVSPLVNRATVDSPEAIRPQRRPMAA